MRNYFKHIILLLLIGLWGFTLKAQYTYLNNFRGMNEVLHAHLYLHPQNFHPDVQPYYKQEVEQCVMPDIVFQFEIPKNNSFYRRMLTSNLLVAHHKLNYIMAVPIINCVGGVDFAHNKGIYETGIGLRMHINFSNKVALGGSIVYNHSVFPSYINNKIEVSRVVPGQGYAYGFGGGGYNYLNYDCYANYHFMKYFTLEGGFGKNFWGDGYRSLFLSDNAYSYPYLKLTTNVWHIKFINLYTEFKDMTGVSSSRWSGMNNKYGAFHYLSWDVSKRVNIGFFESVIWEGKDSAGNRGFDYSYLNPVVFLRPVEFSRGSPDNSLMGFSIRVKVGRKTSLYSQFLIDDIVFKEAIHGLESRFERLFNKQILSYPYGFWSNKEGWQLGVKSYDMFKVKNLSGLLEFNWVRPYTYAHRRVQQNYGHYNEALAHPEGANFREISAFLWYSHKRWFVEGHFNYIVTGVDSTNSDFGQDIYKPVWDVADPGSNNVPVQPYFNNIAQGIKTHIAYYSLNVSYLLNPKNNLRFVAGYYYYSSSSKIKNTYGSVFSLGIKMGLGDRHIDY